MGLPCRESLFLRRNTMKNVLITIGVIVGVIVVIALDAMDIFNPFGY